jgi:hypothetical protein
MQTHHTAVFRSLGRSVGRVAQVFSILCLLTACLHQQAAPPAFASSSFSEFQWTLLTGGTIFFFSQDNTLVPAQAVDAQILESIPPKKRILLLGTQERLTVPLQKLVSPYSINSNEWILQIEQNNGWIAAEDFHFTDRGFVTNTRSEPIDTTEFSNIRFISR